MNKLIVKAWPSYLFMVLYASNSYGYFETLSTQESILADPVVNAVVNDPLDQIKGDEVAGDNEPKVMVGAQYISMENNDVINIPVSYGTPVSFLQADERLSFNANLSYIDTSSPLNKQDEASTGDSTIGVDYSYYDELQELTVIPSLLVKLSTGDEDKGLGTGSTDIAGTLYVKKDFGQAAMSAEIAYMFKGEGEPQGFKHDYGDIFTLDFSGRYEVISGLWVGVNGIYVDQDGNEDLSSNIRSKSGGMTFTDLIPTVTYRVKDLFNINARYVLTISEDADNGATLPDRENSFSLSVSRGF